jgi:hypothetical protein
MGSGVFGGQTLFEAGGRVRTIRLGNHLVSNEP